MSKNPKNKRKKRAARAAIRRSRSSRVGPDATPAQAQIPRPRVSDYTVLTLVPVDALGHEVGRPAGASGGYDVVFVLGVPGINTVATAVNIDQLLDSGDSLLAGTGLQIELEAEDTNRIGTAKIIPNKQGRLAQVRLSVNAVDFADAQQQAHDAVMPVLSRLAFEADVPVEVTATIMTEQATHSRRVGTTLVGAVQPAPEPSGWSTEELRPFLSIYREGLNSTTPFYQALSFYKIIEGAAGFHTRRVRAATRANATPPPDPMAARIPADAANLPITTEWARDLFTPFLGQTFSDVEIDAGRTVRNAVAHLSPGIDPSVADYLDDIHACQKVVPVLRYIARELIQGELAAAATRSAPTPTVTDSSNTAERG